MEKLPIMTPYLYIINSLSRAVLSILHFNVLRD